MTANADGVEKLVQMGGGGDAEDVLYGLMRTLETMRELSPPVLVDRRCQKCNKLLCRAERNARLEIKCPRCRHMATFP